MPESASAELFWVLEIAANEHRRLHAIVKRLSLVVRALGVAVVISGTLVKLSAWDEALLEVLGQTSATTAVLRSLVALEAVRGSEGLELAVRAKGVDLVDPAGMIRTEPRPDAVCLVDVDTLALLELVRGVVDRPSDAVVGRE